ncbi:hypothetical protein DFR50_107139 [Roseiarcus fermentans]|uniref:Uncharacterized protein n=1 Tax=Roseiarcus fermentans TaxID=1473586 RepID=A0A366FQ68_9HYPH|nr:hypothetical protein [Roseiarcus fermentans]RBP15869.1 hypothetical protein DFR50_107139 [Roseiarcus fermentans]
MIDLGVLLTAMARSIQQPRPLDWSWLAPTLGIDIGEASVVGAGKLACAMTGARLPAQNIVVGGALFEQPIREIALMFPDDAVRDANVKALRFGTDQRISPSRASDGYAIVCKIGGIESFVLVSGVDSVVQGLLVRSPPAL